MKIIKKRSLHSEGQEDRATMSAAVHLVHVHFPLLRSTNTDAGEMIMHA